MTDVRSLAVTCVAAVAAGAGLYLAIRLAETWLEARLDAADAAEEREGDAFFDETLCNCLSCLARRKRESVK